MIARASAVIGLMMGSGVVFVSAAHAQTVASAEDEADPPRASKSVLMQPAGLVVEEVPLTAALVKLSESSGVVLAFSPSLASEVSHRVSCDCVGRTVGEALSELLRATPFTYAEVKRQVMIYHAVPPEPALELAPTRPSGWRGGFVALASAVKLPIWLPVSSSWQTRQEGPVAGTVTDRRTMEPIEGAQVMVEGTNRGVATGADGRFRFEELQGPQVTLRVEMLGYRTVTQTARVAVEDVRVQLEVSALALDEVVVTGTLVPTKARALPTPVSIITAEQIAQKKVVRVDQLFRGAVPGVVAYDLASNDNLAYIFTRGRSSMQASTGPKVYIDGVEMGSPTFLPSLDAGSIERVEVIRGPQASTLYGSDALAGVIQIFTKKGSLGAVRPQVDLNADVTTIESEAVGDVAVAHNLSGSVTGGGDEFSYNVGGSRRYTGEYLPNYNNTRSGVYGGFGGMLGAVRGEFSMRYFRNRYRSALLPLYEHLAGLGGPATLGVRRDQDQFNRTVTLSSNLTYSPVNRLQFNLVFGYDRFNQEIVQNEPYNTTPDDTLLTMFNFEGQLVKAQLTGALDWEFNTSLSANLLFGADYRSQTSNNISATGPTLRGSLATVNYATRDFTSNAGYFAQANLNIRDHLYLTTGLRIEDNPNIGEEYGFHGLAVAPRVGISYLRDIGPVTAKTRVSYGKAIRPPSYAAKHGATYSADDIRLPNPEVGPEVQVGVDLGIELYYRDVASLEANYYNQDAEDLVALTYLTVTFPRTSQYQNVGRIHNDGFEFMGKVRQGPFQLDGTFTIMNSTVEKLSPSYTGEFTPGDRMTNVPKYSGGATLQYIAPRWNASWEVTYIGAQTDVDWWELYPAIYGITSYTGSYRDYWTEYPGFAKFNFGLGYDVSEELQASLRIENLTDSDAVEWNNLSPSRGRQTTIGLHWKP